MNEYFIDTNIFIRYFIADIPSQFQEAKKHFEEIEQGHTTGLISILVINETIWILEHYYELKRKIYIPKLLKILLLDRIKIVETKKDLIVKILETMQRRSFDFTDIYLSQITSRDKLLSFDKDFEKLFK